MKWQKVREDTYLYQDSCNVYAVAAPEGMVVLNAGTGQWLDHLAELPKPVRAVACTHFFRDHSAGAARAARQGIAVYAPYWEQEQFADPLGLFQRRETYIVYDNIWDFFSPIEPIPVSHWLMDWETVRIAGMDFTVLPTAGMTIGAVTLLCKVGGDKDTAAFCGEVIHSPGKVARLAPLQQMYNDLCGAVSLIHSIDLLRREKPALLLPSLGVPMLDHADDALSQLDATMRATLADRPDLLEELARFDQPELLKITDHIYQSTFGCACTWFLLSRSGKAMAIDYGHCTTLIQFRNYTYPRHRRSKLHGLAGLKEQFGIDGLDLVIPTHFHDDHVSGIPLLQRLYGTQCWVGENYARILADPAGYNFPCTWPEPIKVQSQPLGVPLKWEEYTFTLEPVHGHTRWSHLVFFEADGRRICATGDQHFFHKFTGEMKPLDDYDGSPYYTNWVYRNGAMLNSMNDSVGRLQAHRPEMILPGHGHAYLTNEKWYKELDNVAESYVRIHRRAMPLGEHDTHFEVDSRSGWLEPYRVHVPCGCECGTGILPVSECATGILPVSSMGVPPMSEAEETQYEQQQKQQQQDRAKMALKHTGRMPVPRMFAGGVVPDGADAECVGPLKFRAYVRNPLPRAAELCVRLVGPEAWVSKEVRVSAGSREEVSANLEITPREDATCRRQPIAMELSIDGQAYGQIAEALVTIGHERW
jgi:glyoxylase-like metal-dependent hydrolase (beta-lactamase superfamily II)